MIARRKRLAAMCAAVCIGSLAAGSVGAATSVENLHLKHNDAFTELSIPVPSHLLCEHFTLPASGDKPFRVVLDFCETRHALPQQQYADLPTSVVTRIRTSQYAEAPQPIVRVVLDLREAATYTVRSTPGAVVVAVADPQRAAFAEWQANPGAQVSSPPEPLADERPHGELATIDELAVIPERARVVPPPKTAAPKTAHAARADLSRYLERPDVTVNTEVVAEPVVRPPTVAVVVPEREQSHPAPDALTERTTRETAPVVKPEIASGPKPAEVQAPTVAVLPAPFVPPERPLVLAPDHLELGEMAAEAVASERQLGAQPVADRAVETPSANQPVTTDDYAVTPDDPNIWASVDTPADAGTPIDAMERHQEQSLLDRLKTKFFGDKPAPRPYTTTSIDPSIPAGAAYGPPTPDGAGLLDRKALLERIRLAEEDAVQHGGIPVQRDSRGRAEVRYDDMGRRDPFQRLLGGLRSGFVTDELPNVENLRMVGVLRDDYDSMALLEDMEGHSYILRPGDPVENGHVVAVQEQRVLFQVDDYGWTRTVALQLSPRGNDPTKALGFNSNSETDSGSEEDNDSKNGE
ncbi:MAG TPA: hypothetical protein VM118_01095 [Acidobacteriota bacterium]|nr:hypothetical protein [Acidobacteriota bacterium]